MDLLTIRNTGSKSLVLRHDGKGHVTIAPGTERILPADYAFIHFGHPAARNVGRDKERDAQFAMCRTLWGFYPGLMNEDEWEHIKPAFEVYDLDGERVYMVLDDPDGSLGAARSGIPSLADSDAVERAGVEAQIAAMQAQIDALTNLLMAQHAGQVSQVGTPGRQAAEGDSGADPAGEAESQEARNEKRDNIPKPPADEPPVTSDKPRTNRVGRR